jgi:hypothetical protein
MDVLMSIAGALLSLIGLSIASSEVFKKLARQIFGKKPSSKTYSARLSELTSSLTTASSQVDSVLRELSFVAREKEDTVKKLEAGLGELERREQELKQKIEALQNVPLPVAEQFAKLVEPSERRSARRDYILFGAGVVVTTIITLLLQVFSK